jgi:predicted dithiol-disulfide oxidoreductase (DUF899 family)
MALLGGVVLAQKLVPPKVALDVPTAPAIFGPNRDCPLMIERREPMMTDHKIGTREEWLAAREALLAREKEHTRLGDELARQRRELPWVPLEKEYRFDTEDGTRSLAELFDGRSQLIVYHFMFGPGYTAGCATCSATADSFNGVLPHLQARDVTMICISRAPLEKLLAYRRRMGWSFNWASSYESDFNFDFGVSATRRRTRPRRCSRPTRSRRIRSSAIRRSATASRGPSSKMPPQPASTSPATSPRGTA